MSAPPSPDLTSTGELVGADACPMAAEEEVGEAEVVVAGEGEAAEEELEGEEDVGVDIEGPRWEGAVGRAARGVNRRFAVVVVFWN